MIFPKWKISAIDLFCGVGGLTHGLIQSGISVVAGIDNAENCEFPYSENNSGAQFILKDVKSLNGDDLNVLWGDAPVRLLAGCAPCQPFSNYRQKNTAEDDTRYPLMQEFLRLIDETRPDFVAMENVPNVIKKNIFSTFTQKIYKLGYKFNYSIVKCEEIGIPQKRRRLVLIASLLEGQPSCIAANQKNVTVRNAFQHLNKIAAGEKDPSDPLHRCASLSKKNMERIKCSKPGGTWKDWPKSLRLECHNRDSGSGYTPVYGRLAWDEPAPTITTQCYNYGSGRFGHPEEDRPISLREAALLQGFPAKYVFEPDAYESSIRDVAKMIGNAVPVGLGKAIGDLVIHHLTKIDPYEP